MHIYRSLYIFTKNFIFTVTYIHVCYGTGAFLVCIYMRIKSLYIYNLTYPCEKYTNKQAYKKGKLVFIYTNQEYMRTIRYLRIYYLRKHSKCKYYFGDSCIWIRIRTSLIMVKILRIRLRRREKLCTLK